MDATLPTVDKSAWGDGPWMTEPDRAEWTHAGRPCLAVRNSMGNWCGYAAVDPGHPLHGLGYSSAPDLDVHGGLTYANRCAGSVCHVPQPGEPDDVWWFGFDCGHAWDIAPAMVSRMKEIYASHGESDYMPLDLPGSSYKTLDYVKAEVNKLAEQLVEANNAR